MAYNFWKAWRNGVGTGDLIGSTLLSAFVQSCVLKDPEPSLAIMQPIFSGCNFRLACSVLDFGTS